MIPENINLGADVEIPMMGLNDLQLDDCGMFNFIENLGL